MIQKATYSIKIRRYKDGMKHSTKNKIKVDYIETIRTALMLHTYMNYNSNGLKSKNKL